MSNVYLLHEADPVAAGAGGASGDPAGGGAVRCVPGDDEDLAVFEAALGEAQAALARVVVAAGRLAGSGVCERVEGVDLERFAGLACRLTGGEARRLVATGEVLRDTPVLAALVAEGRVGVSQAVAVRPVLAGLSRAQRRAVDERVGAQVAAAGGVEAFDPDGLVEAVERAADDCRQQRSRVQRDQRARRANRVALQQGLDGRVRIAGEYDAVAGAVVVNALDAASAPPQADAPDADPGAVTYGSADGADGAGAGDDPRGADPGAGDDADADAGSPVWVRRTRHGVTLADAFVEVAADYLAGHTCTPTPGPVARGEGGRDGAAGCVHDGHDGHGGAGDGAERDGHGAGAAQGWWPDGAAHPADPGHAGYLATRRGRECGRSRRARPLVVVHVDLAQVTGHADGGVEVGVRGGLPRVSAATVEALAASGEVQAVLFEGARPLAVTGKVDASRVPAATAVAVRARDRGCRFPASRDPIGHTDLHHLRERARGGGHDPDNLVALSRRWHTTVHRHGWRLTLHPHTGQLTVERAGRRYHSLPRGTPLPPAPDPPPRSRDPGHHHDHDRHHDQQQHRHREQGGDRDPPGGHEDDDLPF